MRYLNVLWLALALSACVSPLKDETIQSVTFSSSMPNPFVPQNALKVSSDLTTVWDSRFFPPGGQDQSVHATGAITQAQFDGLVQKLEAADYRTVKSTDLTQGGPPPVGGRTERLAVQTSGGNYEFADGSGWKFPPAIATIYTGQGEYMPAMPQQQKLPPKPDVKK